MDPSLTNFRHVPDLLLDQRALEYHQHEQGEDRVVPVLVQAPQTDTEHLEHEEWGRGSLYEQLLEFGDGIVFCLIFYDKLSQI